MKRHIIYILSALLVAFFATGCADDLRNRSVFDAGGGDVMISFAVENVSLTRSGDDVGMESKIDHAYLLFYSMNADPATARPLAAVRAEVDESSPEALSFKMPLLLEPNTAYHLVAVANADFYVAKEFSDFKEYVDSWWRTPVDGDTKALQLQRSAPILAKTVDCLPMRGDIVDDEPFRFSIDKGVYKVSARLTFRRLVARIDVANMATDEFHIESVALCNWRDAVPVTTDFPELGNGFGNVCGILTDDDRTFGDEMFVEMPEDEESNTQQLKEALYCFPSVCYDSSPSDNESTAIIIKAKYGDDVAASYYRVNVGQTANKSELRPNTKYLVTVQSVSGSGAATAEEAYAAEESPIVLSVVEDWDLEENNFVVDGKGNYIAISSSRFDFESDDEEARIVKVLTSKGMNWSVDYVADNPDSQNAFDVEKVLDASLKIWPTGENITDRELSGKIVVRGSTPEGNELSAYVSVSQANVEEKPYEPVIPENLPFALIPVNGNHVKIDHENRTIEIDAFDPTCFNSFIDIPFKFYINEAQEVENDSYTITSDLQWPLEGIVSKKMQAGYVYCSNSFTSSPKVYSKEQQKELDRRDVSNQYDPAFTAYKNDKVYISVGAMAPDDPTIVRKLSISTFPSLKNIEYTLIIKPRPVIIDDVVLTEDGGQKWLICDRNIQDLQNSKLVPYIDRQADGRKYQAYNYMSQGYPITIPLKFSTDGNPFSENQYSMYLGKYIIYSNRNTLLQENAATNVTSRKSWLNKYVFKPEQKRNSPFYEESNIYEWNYPKQSFFPLCGSRMCMSKMRMFLVSEVPVKSGKDLIPVCCYWPYSGDPMAGLEISKDTYGYYVASESGNLEGLAYVYCDLTEMTTTILNTNITNLNQHYGLSRLVRPLTDKELSDYKQNYLGYGSTPHSQTICHPDTYSSTPDGWIRY